MEWWLWLILGLLLLAVELFTPGGFFLLFFGIGAIVTGAVGALGVPPADSLPVQIVLFLVVSLAGLLLFRNALTARFARRPLGGEVDSLAQSDAIAQEDIPANATGKVELRGASWTARNAGPEAIIRGQRCTVERVDGLTLWVRAASDDPISVQPAKEPVL
jgi:inner membrane protein